MLRKDSVMELLVGTTVFSVSKFVIMEHGDLWELLSMLR